MDIVQSVLQSFFAKAGSGQFNLDVPYLLRALLVAMARNKLAEPVRRQQRGRRDVRRVVGEAVDPHIDSSAGASRVLAGRDLLREVRRRLSPEELRLVDLRTEGSSWAEIAAELGGTSEGLRKQLSRAVDRVVVELDLD